jgi:3-phenylpropionate/cinnamic acid dioxygenase small subunit
MTIDVIETGALVDMPTWFEVNRFMNEEARLLDERRYEQWLTLLTDDVHYWAPSRRVRTVSSDPEDRSIEHELSAPGDSAVLDERMVNLQLRVARWGQARLLWCDNPPARVRHLITNVDARYTDRPDELSATSNFCVYQARFDEEGTKFFGQRQDILRRTEEGLKIASRKVILDSTVLWAKAITMIF